MRKLVFALLLGLAMAFALSPGVLADKPLAAEAILFYEAEKAGAATIEQWLREELPQTMGIGGEWYAFALAQQGVKLPECREALEAYLASRTVRSATSRLKFQMVRLALGGDIGPDWHEDILQQGVMSRTWGLHLLNNGCDAPITAAEVIAELLALQLEDGGWANTGKVSDPDVTAMVLQALAPHQAQEDVAPAVARAVARLDALRREDGGYASYGVPCPESAAQVAIARMSLGLDATDLLPVLEAYHLPEGGYSHTLGGAANTTATMQVYLAYAAFQRQQAGLSPLYILSPQEAGLPWKAAVVLVIAGAAAAVVIILFLMGKRSPKNALVIGVLAALAMAAVLLIDIQSPAAYYREVPEKGETIGTATLSITCDTVAGRAAHIPADGVMLSETAFPMAQGDTVFTLLTDAARAKGLLIESSGGYVTGINNLFEFDFGPLSGWVFFVNGEEASVGSDQIVLSPGDRVMWRYTLELGKDLP